MGKIITGVAGAVIGMAACAVILPNLDRRTQRTVKRAGRRLRDAAEDAYDSLSALK
ncbi:MAG: YtxH domain-containing protein [Clostridium sp.]|uniref:YtxH domain-containing protein n=1 Tax=Clostridium sp. TaxID=1506 RepID=UPI003F38D8AE